MKKTLAVILSILMVLSVTPLFGMAAEKTVEPASGYVSYDSAGVSGGDVAELSYNQIAAIVLDWADRKVAAVAEDFGLFNATVDVPVTDDTVKLSDIININDLDDVFAYAGYLSLLGGDFAQLDTTAINGLSRENGDINLIFAIFEFMATNSELFGKVFSWEEGQTFDFGLVGEYIETLQETDPIRRFYNDYLMGNDIQNAFVSEIAREMGYTVTEGETFDNVLNNGIKAIFSDLFSGFLSEDARAALLSDDFNLRTADVYTLIRSFVALLQSDNQAKLTALYVYTLDNFVRPALKLALGNQAQTGAAVTNAALVNEFKGVYTDLDYLYEISGGTVNYRAADGNYYVFTVANDGGLTVNSLTWENTLGVDFAVPTATVYSGATGTADRVISDGVNSHNCDVVKTYTPTGKPSVNLYSQYAEQMAQEVPEGVELELYFSNSPVPADYTAIKTTGTPAALKELFAFTLDQGENTLFSLPVSFAEIEQMAEEKAYEIALPVFNSTKESLASTPFVGSLIQGLSLTKIDVELSYTGFSTEDEFYVEVSATANPVITGAGADQAISFVKPAVDSAIAQYVPSPIATIVVDNLSGTADMGAADFANALDTDFDIDRSLIDFSGNYDSYNGVIGQANHIMVGLVNMLLTDEGEAEFALTDGNNTYFDANLEKIRSTAKSIMDSLDSFLADNNFSDFIDSASLNEILKAAQLFKIDFTTKETMFTDIAKIALEFLKQSGFVTDTELLEVVDQLALCENLDQMAVVVANKAVPQAISMINTALSFFNKEAGTEYIFDYTYQPIEVSDVAADGVEDAVMSKVVDMAFEGLTYAVDTVANGVINKAIDEINGKVESLNVPHVAFTFDVTAGGTWEETLDAMLNRVIDLANGLLVVAGSIDTADTAYNKLSAIGNAIVPFCSMFSNCASDKYPCDFTFLADIAFNKVLNGSFSDFLRLFEANDGTNKQGDVAYNVSVTEALINASEYIVDSFFPDTVRSELYVNLAQYSDFTEETVQEYFTSSANDAVIASNNMDSLNARKQNIVPAILELVRESGVLPALVNTCTHEGTTVEKAAVDSTCIAKGHEAGTYCTACNTYVSGGGEKPLAQHSFGEATAVSATCTENGSSTKVCLVCGTTEVTTLPATGHSYPTEWTVTRQPKCNQTGLKIKACASCDSVLEETIAKLPCDYQADAGRSYPATCTATGLSAKTCTMCGGHNDTVIPAKGHAWGGFSVTAQATCTQKGVETRVCSVCNATESREIPMTSHVDSDDDNTCDNCGATIKQLNFFQKIAQFFKNIFNWFKNLFRR